MVCKAVAVNINWHLTESITYHYSLHGFQAGRSTGTATLEVKLRQQVTSMREDVLNAIFQRRRWCSIAGKEDYPGKRWQTKADGGGTCPAECEVIMLLCGRQDGGLHQPGGAPYLVWHADEILQLGGTEDKHQENRGYGVPTIPGVWGTGIQSLNTEYYGGG